MRCTSLSREWREASILSSSPSTRKIFLEFPLLPSLFRPKTFAEVRKTLVLNICIFYTHVFILMFSFSCFHSLVLFLDLSHVHKKKIYAGTVESRVKLQSSQSE